MIPIHISLGGKSGTRPNHKSFISSIYLLYVLPDLNSTREISLQQSLAPTKHVQF